MIPHVVYCIGNGTIYCMCIKIILLYVVLAIGTLYVVCGVEIDTIYMCESFSSPHNSFTLSSYRTHSVHAQNTLTYTNPPTQRYTLTIHFVCSSILANILVDSNVYSKMKSSILPLPCTYFYSLSCFTDYTLFNLLPSDFYANTIKYCHSP